MLYVYFIQQGDGGPIKIGIAGDPKQRLRMLQSGNPVTLRLLATRPGAYELEADMHARFAGGRIRGEWFDPRTEGLAEAIEDARAADRTPYVTRREIAGQREAIESRAVDLARNGYWDEAQRVIATVPPEALNPES